MKFKTNIINYLILFSSLNVPLSGCIDEIALEQEMEESSEQGCSASSGCQREEDDLGCRSSSRCLDQGASLNRTDFDDSTSRDAQPREQAYDYILITDYSRPESDIGSGTGGVDICSVVVRCGENIARLSVAGFSQGTGVIEEHSDPIAATLFEDECEPRDRSHYVCLGLNGSLLLESDLPLVSGCTIDVNEFIGSTEESYRLQVCADSDGSMCREMGADFPRGGAGRLSL